MLEEYLRQIEELLSTSPVVRDVEIVRRTVRDTALEKVLNYRYRVMLADGGPSQACLARQALRYSNTSARDTTSAYF